jgi:processive 1,2-diacylglycerol beta-glucosyltransferase
VAHPAPGSQEDLPRVLILSASAGAGHVRAGQALERALVATSRVREVRHVDVLQYTSKFFRQVYAQAYLDLVNRAPEVLGWMYDYFDEPGKHARLRLALDKLNATRFIRLLEDYQPDWAVSTHFLPAEIIAWLRSKGRLATRQAIVVTDFDVQGMWLTRHVDRYFVALDETRVHLEHLGVPSAAITVSGIPIDPVFTEPKDTRAMRVKHGLALDRTTILVSAGGFGVGPVEGLVHTLLELQHPAQLVVICGRSAELKGRLDELAAARPASVTPTLRVVGYTTEMDEYMAAADVLVGKPGGLTSSEALARGLGLVIVHPIPGQEERNADHLLEAGAAIRCEDVPTRLAPRRRPRLPRRPRSGRHRSCTIVPSEGWRRQAGWRGRQGDAQATVGRARRPSQFVRRCQHETLHRPWDDAARAGVLGRMFGTSRLRLGNRGTGARLLGPRRRDPDRRFR